MSTPMRTLLVAVLVYTSLSLCGGWVGQQEREDVSPLYTKGKTLDATILPTMKVFGNERVIYVRQVVALAIFIEKV